MSQTLHYKYGIGDTVRLVREPFGFPGSLAYGSFSKKWPPAKEYKIRGWGWLVEEEGVYKQFYQLDAYCDDYLDYHNRILEDDLEVIGEAHPFEDTELEYYDRNNEKIFIGMNVYYDVYYGDHKNPYINDALTFTRYGEVIGIEKFRSNYDNKNRLIVRCITDKHFNHDTNKYELSSGDNQTSSEIPYYVFSKIPETFAQDYINELFRKRNSSYLGNEDNCNYSNIVNWLKHMGVYDEVMELYKARKAGKKPSKKKSTTDKTSSEKKKEVKPKKQKVDLESMLANLSEADKKKLKKLLS